MASKNQQDAFMDDTDECWYVFVLVTGDQRGSKLY